MSSRAVVLSLNAKDQLSAIFGVNSVGIYSNSFGLTTLKGFLFSPYRIVPISWCVMSDLVVGGTDVAGPVAPVTLNTVLVNQGSGWIRGTNHFLTPSSGTYYVQLTAGLKASQPTKMELLVNGIPINNVHRQFAPFAEDDTRSRAV